MGAFKRLAKEISKVKEKPADWRRRFSWLLAGLLTVPILLVWLANWSDYSRNLDKAKEEISRQVNQAQMSQMIDDEPSKEPTKDNKDKDKEDEQDQAKPEQPLLLPIEGS